MEDRGGNWKDYVAAIHVGGVHKVQSLRGSIVSAGSQYAFFKGLASGLLRVTDGHSRLRGCACGRIRCAAYGTNLLGHHREHGKEDSVELVEAAPKPALA